MQLVNVVVGGQTYTALYRVKDDVLKLSFAGHEVLARLKGADPEVVAERLLRALLVERAAVKLREIALKSK